MYRLSMGWITVSGASLPEIPIAAGKAGFSSFTARISGRYPGDPNQLLLGNPALLRDFRASIDDAGIPLVKVTSYKFSPDIKMEDFAPVIETAGELGVGTLSIGVEDKDESRIVDNMAQYADMAASIGARVAVEFAVQLDTKAIERGYRLLLRTGKTNIGLTLDALLLARAGDHPDLIRKFDPDRIFGVQICDAPRRKSDDIDLQTETRAGRYYPGEGELPLYELLDALPSDFNEIECEIPHALHGELPPNQRAKQAYDATYGFLEKYLRERRSGATRRA